MSLEQVDTSSTSGDRLEILDRSDRVVAGIGLAVWGFTALVLLAEVTIGIRPCLMGAALIAGAALLLVRLVRLPDPVRRVCVGTALLAVVCTTVVTWRVLPLQTDPLVTAAMAEPKIQAVAVINSVPERKSGRTSGSRRLDDSWSCRANIISWSHIGLTPTMVNLPIQLDLHRTSDGLVPGTVVRVFGRARPGEPSRGFGIYLQAYSVDVQQSAPRWQLLASIFRHSVAASVQNQPADVRGLLPGLTVGQTSEMPDDLLAAMRDSGLSHLAAVSGGNISIVIAVWLGALRWSGVRRGRWQLLALALGVLVYVVVVQPQPSVDRAALMALAALGAQALGWRLRPLGVLSATVCLLVLVDPFLSVSPGFAMSVLATAALCVVAARRAGRADRSSRMRRLVNSVISAGICACAATVIVAPVSVWFGNGVQVGGVIANMLAEPAVFPATICGLLAGIVGLLNPGFAALVVLPGCWATLWIAMVARWVASTIARTPWAGGFQGAGLMLLMVCGGILALLIAPTRHIRRLCLAVLGVGLLLTMGMPTPVTTPVTMSTSWPPAGWQIIMCDVGQGDSLLLKVDENSAIAVDTGPDAAAESRCLQRAGIAHVPLVILTHFHADHVEGLAGLLSIAHPSLIEESPLGEPATEARRVHRWSSDAHVKERAAAPGDVFNIGPISMDVLWPQRILRGVGSDPNNSSVTLLANVGGIRVLLGGDLETAAQEAVLATGRVTSVDVVKVPHHGSAKQSPKWALVTRPKIALIGVGLNNDYGHPWPGTVRAYEGVGAVVGRTDLDGDLAVVKGSDGSLALLHRSSWG
jgi:competence protein ComEC